MVELVFEFIRPRSEARLIVGLPRATQCPKWLISAEADARMQTALWWRLAGFIGVPVAIAIVPVIVANLFFFEPVARWATDGSPPRLV